MNLVDIDDGIAYLLDALHHLLDAFLEITTELSSGEHRAKVHLEYLATFQAVRNVPLFNACSKTIYQSGLSHAGFSHMKRIVLVFAAKNLDGTLQFLFTSDQRMMLSNSIIETGNETFPLLAVMAFLILHIRFLSVTIRIFIIRNKLAHKFLHIFGKFLLQHIGRPRIFKSKQRSGQMRNVQFLCT